MRSLLFMVLVVGCADVGAPEAALGEIVGADGDDESDPFLFPSVVYLEDNGCTGTLISPTHVLTAAHCVDGLAGGAARAPSRVAMRGLPAGTEDRVPVSDCVMDIRYWGASIPEPGHTLEECRRPATVMGRPGVREEPAVDFALLTLARPVPHPVPDFAATATPRRAAIPSVIASSGPVGEFAAIAVGRGGTTLDGAGAGPRRYRRLSVTYREDIIFERPAPVAPGDSGGPLFWDEGARVTLVAVASQTDVERDYSFWGTIDDAERTWIAAQLDRNGDGRPDIGGCPEGPGIDLRADATNDVDGDYVLDSEDSCPGIFNPCQRRSDADGDGIDDDCEHCPGDPAVATPLTTVLADGDVDGVPDVCDCVPATVGAAGRADTDADLILAECDNCDTVANTDQADCDGDGVGDACSLDADSDFAIDVCGRDNCLGRPNPSQANCNLDAEIANDLPRRGDACDPVPCTEATFTSRTERRGVDLVDVAGRIRFDARVDAPATLLATGHRFCRCDDAASDTLTARDLCRARCPAAAALTVTALFTRIEAPDQPWRDATLDYASAAATPPPLGAGPPGHPENAFLTYDRPGWPFELYDVDAAADWRLREVDLPRWAPIYASDPGTSAIPGVFWSHSATGPSPALRSGYWSGVLADDRTLISLAGISCAALAQPAPRGTCGGNCLEAPLPDSAWLLERGSIVSTLCRGSATSVADFFFAFGAGALPAAPAFPSLPPLPADDVRWISLAEPIELLPEGRDLRLVGVSLDGARVISQLVEGRFGFTPRGFFPGCPGGPNCPPQFAACAPGESCLVASEPSASARAAAAPEPTPPVLVLSAARGELFVFAGGEARAIDLELGTRRMLEVGDRPLGRVLAATYDVLRDRLFVLDEVVGHHGRARVRLVELDPSGAMGEVLARWPRGAATTRFALTAARDGQLYLVASGERGQHALVALSLDDWRGVRLIGLSLGDGILASDRAYASDSGISYVVARSSGLEVVNPSPVRARWRGRAPSDWCF